MAVAEKHSPSSTNVVRIDRTVRGESLWLDSWRRLRRNRAALLGAIVILINILVAVFASALAPKPYDLQVLADNNSAPLWVTKVFPTMLPLTDSGGYITINENYFLGADSLGRDLFSRIIYGTQVSLLVAFIGPLSAILLGMTVGLIAGYAKGKVDNLLMRIVDIMYAFPTLLLVILFMAFFRFSSDSLEPGTLGYVVSQIDRSSGGLLFVFVGIGITSWMGMARLVRGQVLSVREKEYIEAARSLGTGRRDIVLRHILPNILGPVIVAETLSIPTYISYEAFLSFIGLGVNAPRPSWGGMIAEGAQRIASYPNQVIFPALALFLIMFAFNFLGDGLRDALDPRMRGVD